MIVGFRRHFLLLANICWRKADEEMEAVAVDARFQRSAVALADAPHARQPVAVGALVRFRGGKIGVDLSVDRIVDGEHEKPLVGAAARTILTVSFSQKRRGRLSARLSPSSSR